MSDRDDRWPDLAGRLIPGGHVLPVRVYFEDTDFSGVVYHGSYIRFMERGRSDFLRLLGVGHDALDRGERAWRAARLRRPPDRRRIPQAGANRRRAGGRNPARRPRRRPHHPVADGPARRRVLVTAEVTVVMINGAGQARRLPDGGARGAHRGAPLLNARLTVGALGIPGVSGAPRIDARPCFDKIAGETARSEKCSRASDLRAWSWLAERRGRGSVSPPTPGGDDIRKVRVSCRTRSRRQLLQFPPVARSR